MKITNLKRILYETHQSPLTSRPVRFNNIMHLLGSGKWSEKLISFLAVRGKTINPLLYDLANIIYAIPITQTSAEQSFSHLKFVYCDLHQNIVTSIILLLLNKLVV